MGPWPDGSEAGSDGHPSTTLLAQFMDGDVAEAVAVALADHIDVCPSCSARAAQVDPLHLAFAAVPDPAVPVDLLELQPDPAQTGRRWSPEPVVAAALLAGAAAILMGAGAPEQVLQPMAHLASGVWTLLQATIGRSTALVAIWLVAASALLMVAVATVRAVDARRSRT